MVYLLASTSMESAHYSQISGIKIFSNKINNLSQRPYPFCQLLIPKCYPDI